MTRASRVLAAFLFFFALPLLADKAADIDAVAKKFEQFGRFNGSLLVADHGKVILSKGYGKANFEWDVPNTPDTKFRLGSITKQFTSMVVMQLVQEGKLNLDDTIVKWLPDYRKDTGSKVTIRHLLTHTSGVPNYTNIPGFMLNEVRKPARVAEFVTKYCSGDLEFEPGSKYTYSNSGYFILGAIIEKASGKPYEKNLQERIFTPLGMKSSGYDHETPLIRHRASGYVRTPDGVQNSPFIDMTVPFSAGALYSTVEDLFLWDRALYGDKLLDPALKKTMFTPALNNYAFGWVVTTQKLDDATTVNTIGHDGGVNGFSTTLVRFPDEQNFVVILDNTSQGANISKLRKTIAQILYGRPYETPKPSLAAAVMKTLKESGAEKAAAQFRELTASKSADYDIDEAEVNQLGYQLLASGKTDDAITIFKLNVERFPKSWNVYDSLAEAYLAKGDRNASTENYKESLALNPANTNAKSAIEKMQAPAAKIDPALLQAYVGVYDLAPTFAITITTEAGGLYGQATGQPRFGLLPKGENEFTVDVADASITFEKDPAGTVTGLVLHQGGRDMKAAKRK